MAVVTSSSIANDVDIRQQSIMDCDRGEGIMVLMAHVIQKGLS